MRDRQRHATMEKTSSTSADTKYMHLHPIISSSDDATMVRDVYVPKCIPPHVAAIDVTFITAIKISSVLVDAVFTILISATRPFGSQSEEKAFELHRPWTEKIPS